MAQNSSKRHYINRRSTFSDAEYNTHSADKPKEKCPCENDPGTQDWNMSYRNSYPILKKQSGIGAPVFDNPNYRAGIFDHMQLVPPERAKMMPGRSYRPAGIASLDASRVPVINDRPRYNSDHAEDNRYVHDPLHGADPLSYLRKGEMDSQAATFGLMGLIWLAGVAVFLGFLYFLITALFT